MSGEELVGGHHVRAFAEDRLHIIGYRSALQAGRVQGDQVQRIVFGAANDGQPGRPRRLHIHPEHFGRIPGRDELGHGDAHLTQGRHPLGKRVFKPAQRGSAVGQGGIAGDAAHGQNHVPGFGIIDKCLGDERRLAGPQQVGADFVLGLDGLSDAGLWGHAVGSGQHIGPQTFGHLGEDRFLCRLGDVAFLDIDLVGRAGVTVHDHLFDRSFGDGEVNADRCEVGGEFGDHLTHATGIAAANARQDLLGGRGDRLKLHRALAADIQASGVAGVVDLRLRLRQTIDQADDLQPKHRENPGAAGQFGELVVHAIVVIVGDADDADILGLGQVDHLSDGSERREIGRQMNVRIELQPSWRDNPLGGELLNLTDRAH